MHLVCNTTKSSCRFAGRPVCPWWQMDTVPYTLVMKNVDLRSQKLFQLIARNKNKIWVILHWCLSIAGSTMNKTCMNDSHLVMLFTLSVTVTLHFQINITRFFLKVLLTMKSIYVQAGYKSIWLEREVFWKMWNVLLCKYINVTRKNADSLEVPITTQYRKFMFASFGCVTLEKWIRGISVHIT